MKRVLLILLSICLLVGLCACSPSVSQDKPEQTTAGNTEPASEQTEDADSVPEGNVNAKITLESCKFADEVRAADSECATMLYQDKEGKIYVDMVLFVMTDSEIDADAFAGYVMYDDQRYDMLFCVDSYTGVSVADDGVCAPGGRVHMFASLPDAAESADLTAVVAVNGKEFTSKVSEKESRAALDQKTELKVGDKKSVLDGLVEFEVISCKYTKVLQAQDTANTKQYTSSKPFVDLVLKITNNLSGEDMVLSDFFGYVVGEEIVRANNKIEVDNNTDLESLSGVAPGKTEYVHVYVNVDEGQNTSDLAMRFNLGGTCYYCYATQE